MVNAFDWTCPFCDRPQIVTDENYFSTTTLITNGTGKHGDTIYKVVSILCRNSVCKELSLSISLHKRLMQPHVGYVPGKEIDNWRLLPTSYAKPQPDFIPAQLREDYSQACQIRDLSPKASATLARRCLQGMIRDFCGINKATLFLEIQELETRVNAGNAPAGVLPESVTAIDHIRKIGNIGAHMEADVNHIIDIDADEAQVLIELIEMLFKEWYVERQRRAERLAKIAFIRAEKDALKQGSA